MANLKELKNRIKGVNDTKKITNAMYLISSTKMTKAKKEYENTKPYFDSLVNEIGNVFDNAPTLESNYFYEGERKHNGSSAYLVVSSDKGLCGPFNENVLRLSLSAIEKEDNPKIYVLGDHGRLFFKNRKIAIVEDFSHISGQPSLRRARDIAQRFILDFYKGEIDKLYIVFTRYKNAMVGGVPEIMPVLPFKREDFKGGEYREINFMPSPEDVLNNIVESYLTGIIYSSLVSSFSSEQVSRMNAMDNANKNAKELLDDLNMKYNRARQNKITTEIIEVSSGAKAKKKKMDEGSNY